MTVARQDPPFEHILTCRQWLQPDAQVSVIPSLEQRLAGSKVRLFLGDQFRGRKNSHRIETVLEELIKPKLHAGRAVRQHGVPFGVERTSRACAFARGAAASPIASARRETSKDLFMKR